MDKKKTANAEIARLASLEAGSRIIAENDRGWPEQFGVCRDTGERVDDCHVAYHPYSVVFDMWNDEREFAVFMTCGQNGMTTVLLVTANVDDVDVYTQKWQCETQEDWEDTKADIAKSVSLHVGKHCDDATLALVAHCLLTSWEP